MIKKLIKNYFNWCKREDFKSIIEQNKLTDQEIINISIACFVSDVPKYLINRLVKCRVGWSYIDANEMTLIMIRCDKEKLLRNGVVVGGEITHESIVCYFEEQYNKILEYNGFELEVNNEEN